MSYSESESESDDFTNEPGGLPLAVSTSVYTPYGRVPIEQRLELGEIARLHNLELFHQNESVEDRRKTTNRVGSSKNIEHNDVCGICLENFETDDDILYPLICFHEFHEECLLKWMEHNPIGGTPCPKCRRNFFGKK